MPTRSVPRRFVPVISMVFVVLLQVPFAFAVERKGSTAPAKATRASSLVFTTASTPAPLIQCLLSPGIQTRNETLTGASGSAGTFAGGTGIVGFAEGVALGTGLIAEAVGPNEASDTGTDHVMAEFPPSSFMA